MKTITAPVPYGYQELRLVHQRYMALAMLVAVTIQMMVIGGYHLSGLLTPIAISEDFPPFPGDTIRVTWNAPIGPTDPDLSSLIVPPKILKGVPLPTASGIMDSNAEYASQKQLSDEANRAFADNSGRIGAGTIIIPPEINDQTTIQIWQAGVKPEPVLTPKPEYPDLALKINLEGSATVTVLLDKEGRVKAAKLLIASEDVFAQPALDAAHKWIFTPALMNGKPVQVWVSIPFKFKLAH